MALSNKPFIFEIFKELEKTKAKNDKIAILKKHDSVALRDILRCIFDDVIQFHLPEGDPPYTPSDAKSAPSNLLKQNKMLTYWVKGGKGDRVAPMKRERIFMDVLESIHPEDALVLLSAKDKKPPVKGVTKKLIEEAFPGLIVR